VIHVLFSSSDIMTLALRFNSYVAGYSRVTIFGQAKKRGYKLPMATQHGLRLLPHCAEIKREMYQQQCFSELPELSELTAKLYTVIHHIDRSFGAKKLTNADILPFQLNFVWTRNTPNNNLGK